MRNLYTVYAAPYTKPTRKLERHRGQVNRLAFTADSRRMLSGSSDRTVKLWAVSTAECLKTFEGHSAEVTGVALVPGRSLALSGSLDGTIRLWDMEAGKTVRVIYDEEDKVACVAVTPDGKAAISGSESGHLRLWDLGSGQCLKVFDRHPACWDMRDMRGLIQASNREFSYNDAIGNLAVAQTYDPENRTFFGHADAVTALVVSPCGCYVISGSRDTTVRLWDLASGKCLWIFGGHDGGSGFWINDVVVSSNGRRVLPLTNKVHAWRLSSKTIHRCFWGILSEKPVFVIDDESISGTCMALARSGRSIFVTTDKDRTVSRFRFPTRKRREIFDLEGQTAKSIAVPPDEAFLAVGTNDGVIALFDLRGRTRS